MLFHVVEGVIFFCERMCIALIHSNVLIQSLAGKHEYINAIPRRYRRHTHTQRKYINKQKHTHIHTNNKRTQTP